MMAGCPILTLSTQETVRRMSTSCSPPFQRILLRIVSHRKEIPNNNSIDEEDFPIAHDDSYNESAFGDKHSVWEDDESPRHPGSCQYCR